MATSQTEFSGGIFRLTEVLVMKPGGRELKIPGRLVQMGDSLVLSSAGTAEFSDDGVGRPARVRLRVEDGFRIRQAALDGAKARPARPPPLHEHEMDDDAEPPVPQSAAAAAQAAPSAPECGSE